MSAPLYSTSERLCLCGPEVVCLLREIVVYRTSQKQLRYLYPTCPQAPSPGPHQSYCQTLMV
jgi:hypothetical protein